MSEGGEYKTAVCVGNPNLSVWIRVYLSLVLSLYLFSLVMDEILKNIQSEKSWCMSFADDETKQDKVVDLKSGGRLLKIKN